MGEPIVPTVQVEKPRFGANGWHAGKGGVRAQTHPARADFFYSGKELHGLWSGEGVLTESRRDPPSISDKQGGHHTRSPPWGPGPQLDILCCLFHFLSPASKALIPLPHFADRHPWVQGGELTCPVARLGRCGIEMLKPGL